MIRSIDIPNRLAGTPQKYLGSSSYGCLTLHEEMLKDRFMHSFRDIIVKNKHLFEGKVILDINCGTGILSLLIGSQGAKKVIGIEPSHLAEYARQNILKNGLEERVHIIQANVRNIQCLPFDIEKVDIIVSQWMAYLLFDENLLVPLVEARARWLKSDGIMFPQNVSLHIAAAQYEHRKSNIYSISHVHGFNFTALTNPMFAFPNIETVPAQNIATNSAILRQINLKKCSADKFAFCTDFQLTALRQDSIHAFVLFFEIEFTKCHRKTYLSSSPHELSSRWKQIVLVFQNHLFVKPNEKIDGVFEMRCENRGFNCRIGVNFSGVHCKTEFFNHYNL